MRAGGSERSRSLVTIALAAAGTAVGVVAGVLASAWLNHPNDSPRSGADDSPAALLPGPAEGPDNARSLATLEARMAVLEGRAAPSGSAAATPPPDAGVNAPPGVERRRLTIEEKKREVVATIAALATEHQREAVDTGWASATAKLIETDIGGMAAQSHFRTGGIECKTTRCRATVEWDSLGQAAGEHSRLLHYPYQADCVRTFTLDDTPQSDGKVRGTLFLECNDWRAAGQPRANVAPPYYAQ